MGRGRDDQTTETDGRRDKMDMKKLIMDFRHFQRERQKTKLVKKMSSFSVTKYTRGAVELSDITVKVHQGAIIAFIDQNGKVFFGLYDTDLTAFDNGEPDSDNDADEENEPTLIVQLYIYAGEESETLSLEFASLAQKRNFVTTLETFLQFSNPNSSADSGTSTLHQH